MSTNTTSVKPKATPKKRTKRVADADNANDDDGEDLGPKKKRKSPGKKVSYEEEEDLSPKKKRKSPVKKPYAQEAQ